MNIRETYNAKLADTVIGNLKKRQIEAVYCATAQEACTTALSYVNPGDSVSFGGSMTLEEAGILSALRDRSDIALSNRYFMSANAITQNGELVNIDGNGNRLAALIYGPEQVIVVAGMNKIVPTVTDAVDRVRNTATPLNCIRLNRATPCASTGVCADCLSSDCICNQIVVTRRSGNPDRIKVILVGEALGY